MNIVYVTHVTVDILVIIICSHCTKVLINAKVSK